MGKEFRLELGDRVDRRWALDLLAECPYCKVPQAPVAEGELWLSVIAERPYPDLRLFPCPYGFFVEITSLPAELAIVFEDWIAKLRSVGECTIIDNDTDEVVRQC